MKSVAGIWLIVAWVCLLTGCTTTETKAPRLTTHCTVEKQSKPAWVMSQVQMESSYSASGVASYHPDTNRQHQQAKANATANLAESIRVTVSSNYQSVLQEKTAGDVRTTSASRLRSIITDAALTLFDLTEKGRWQDPDNCDVWVWVSVPKKTIQDFLILEYAEKELQQLDNTPGLTLQHKTVTASHIVKELEQVSNRKKTPKLTARKKRLVSAYQTRLRRWQQQAQTRKTGCIVAAPARFSPDFKKQAADKLLQPFQTVPWTFIPTSCNNTEQCLTQADEDGFESVILLTLTTRVTPGKMGLHKAVLGVSAVHVDLKTQTILAKIPEEKSALFTFDENDINWRTLVDKIASRNKMVLTGTTPNDTMKEETP